MPSADAPSTSRRLLALLSLLQARRDWPARVLAERLDVTERTVRRDIERLRELDYTIDATRGRDGGYRLGAGSRMPPLLLDDEQAVAVAIALRAAPAAGADVTEAAERALATIGRLLPSALARRMSHVAPAEAAAGPDAADPAVLVAIGEAIDASEELRFRRIAPAWESERPQGPPRRIEPHHLVLHSGHWYVVGWSTEHADWRVHRADRIAPLTHRGRSFTRRTVPGGDPVRFLQGRFRGSDSGGGWSCQGEAVLRAPAHELAPFVAEGSVEALGADRCRIRLGAWSWPALAAAFLRFGADVESAEPTLLREGFAVLRDRAAAVTD